MTRDEILKIAKPILFNTDMVRAIQDNRKTATRRVIKLKYSNTHHEMFTNKYGTRLIEIQDDVEGETFGRNEDGTTWHKLRGYIEPKLPYKKGDYLYVRETWQYAYDMDGNDQMIEGTGRYVYAADDSCPFNDWLMPDGTHRDCMPWHPSIHMPKEAARIFLRVTDVRVERLQDITDEQAKAEGANFRNGKNVGWEEKMRRTAVERFTEIWNSTIPKKNLDKYGWDANPWVRVIEFERIEVDRCGHQKLISVEKAKEIIRSHMEDDGWIPAEKMAPEKPCMVWLSFTNQYASYSRKAYWNGRYFEWRSNGRKVKDNPTAWKPYYTPKPYRPKES